MVRRGFLAAGTAALFAAVILALVPIGAEGVAGNAIRPRYTNFGWFAYAPMPEHPTAADLREAGLRPPQDAVTDRRLTVAVIAGAGIASLAAGLIIGRKRRLQT